VIQVLFVASPMLHLPGIDHKCLTVKFQGLDARLTNVAGQVVKDILV
jgi:hypothetical protein